MTTQLNPFGGTSLRGVQGYTLDQAGRPVLTVTGYMPQIVVGSPAAAVTTTRAAVDGAAHRLQLVTVAFSGAGSGPVVLTVTDGATPVLVLDLNVAVGSPYILALENGGLTGTVGNALTVSVSAGAASSVCTLSTGVTTS